MNNMLLKRRVDLQRAEKDGSPVSSFDDTEASVNDHPPDFRAKRLKTGGAKNVWYRHVVKPLIRTNKPISYRQAFQRRVVQQVGIPVEELHGLHELFLPSKIQYSPLIGMIFAHNHLVDNLYRYGDANEEAVQLIHLLFHALPGGEIQPTHASRNASAHLTPALVGEILEAWSVFQTIERLEMDAEECLEHWAVDLQSLIAEHPDHLASQRGTIEAVKRASQEMSDLEQRDKESKCIRAAIKRIEGDVIKQNKHAIKRLKKELSDSDADETRSKKIREQILESQKAMARGKKDVEDLRAHSVTSADRKAARKALKRAEDAVELEKQSLVALAQTLAKSFWTYDREESCSPPEYLPKCITTAILQSFLWRKYDTIGSLKPYFESMKRLGALACPLQTVLDTIDSVQDQDQAPSKISGNVFGLGVPLLAGKTWSPSKVSEAATLVTGRPGSVDRPAVVPFSYITWAAYSEFPDCGETALRNLLNQIFFNPETRRFDHELIAELRDEFYPRLNLDFIRFYQRHPRPQDATEHNVALEWIDVVSRLNRTRSNTSREAPAIRYRREDEERNIASPLSNLLCVFNALFGNEPLDEMHRVTEVVDRVNQLRNHYLLSVDISGIKKDGFGILSLSAGGVRYELQSYKPVHFGFVQVETSLSEASGRYEFGAFRKLMRHTASTGPRATVEEPSYLEQLALASLFVPYKLQRNKTGRFFRESTPLHYSLLFADLDGAASKQAALRWAHAHEGENSKLDSLVHRIHNYVEPKFGPQKGEKPGLEKQLQMTE